MPWVFESNTISRWRRIVFLALIKALYSKSTLEYVWIDE